MAEKTILKNFIAGNFVNPKGGKYFQNFDPATGEVWAEVPDSDRDDVNAAVLAAENATAEWIKVGSRDRAKILNRIGDLVEKYGEELAQLESRDVGKPISFARDVDIVRTVLNFRYFAAKVLTETTLAAPLDDKLVQHVRREPVGVCGLISPWNYPLYTLTWKLAPCLAMGNTAVCKPSEFTPMTAARFAEILNEAGLPAGVVNIVFGVGSRAGAALAEHPGVPLISFTGSTATGTRIQQSAAPHLKKLSFELGGKNANIIFKDANLDLAVKGSVRASFFNSGQVCLSGSRLLIHEDVYDAFMNLFRREALELRVGDPSARETYMGPLASREQLKKSVDAVEQARREGAKVSVGGVTPTGLSAQFKNGYFYAPTVIENLNERSELWQREIFGPVVTATTFKTEEEAIRVANSTEYGLSASLWTQDISRAHKVAAALKSGTVWVNTWSQRDPRVPFGGVKHSGLGREGGDWSLDFYSELKTVSVALN